MSTYKSVNYESFKRCPETCPAVDKSSEKFMQTLELFMAPACNSQVEELVEKFVAEIKAVGTNALRDALYECVSDRQDLEEEVSSLNDRIAELEREA